MRARTTRRTSFRTLIRPFHRTHPAGSLWPLVDGLCRRAGRRPPGSGRTSQVGSGRGRSAAGPPGHEVVYERREVTWGEMLRTC